MRVEKGKQHFGEQDGLITQKVYAEASPRVKYEMMDIGRDLLPICANL